MQQENPRCDFCPNPAQHPDGTCNECHAKLEPYYASRASGLSDAELVALYRGMVERNETCIAAMQKQLLRFPFGLFHRKPWRSPGKWYEGVFTGSASLRIRILNFIEWLRNAHDCSDPAVACSCSGGFRFP